MPLPVPLEGGWGARHQHILFTIVFQACIRHLRHGGLFAVFLFRTGIRENLKYRRLKAKFCKVFSSTTLTSLLESLWKLLASTDPHLLLCSTADGHHKQQQSHVHAHCTLAACLCDLKFENSMYFSKNYSPFWKCGRITTQHMCHQPFCPLLR